MSKRCEAKHKDGMQCGLPEIRRQRGLKRRPENKAQQKLAEWEAIYGGQQ